MSLSDRDIFNQIIHIYDLKYTKGTFNRNDEITNLDFRGSNIKKLPAELGQLTNLRQLNLSGMSLTELPIEIGLLTNLEILCVSGTRSDILFVPDGLNDDEDYEEHWEIIEYTDPEEKDEYKAIMNIESLPVEIGLLINLKQLDLSDTSIKELPAEIGLLKNLQELYLLNTTQLENLPSTISQLTNLRNLVIAHGPLKELPIELGRLANLERLYLKDTNIKELPTEICQLVNLKSLDLSGTNIKELPTEICQLVNLESLDLSGTNIKELPTAIGLLPKLVDLNLNNIPNLLTPPPEIVSQGHSSIIAFLQEMHRNSIKRYEAKILIVGEGGTGKSSLLRALNDEQFIPALNTTHGIEISTLKLPYPWEFMPYPLVISSEEGSRELTLNVWDFGGQHIYHATHQFFLTKRSLYILVWNARLDADQCRLQFWFETIKALAPECAILLVATHVDERSPDLNFDLYQKNYPQLVEYFSVSNKDKIGIDKLRSKIAFYASHIQFVGQFWPASWQKVEQKLLFEPGHHISAQKYLDICTSCTIEKNIALGTLGNYLHDLGKILYFSDDHILSNFVILKPNWITKAISRVLTDKETRDANGILSHAALQRIWSTDNEDNIYELYLFPMFLRLMERFDLSYQIDPGAPGRLVTHSLVPQLLPYKPPSNLVEWPQANDNSSEMTLEMRYKFNFVPAGIISRFIVRTHHYTQNMHWREGVVLKYQEHMARVELNPFERSIRLMVWGIQPHNFFSILMNTLDLILRQFEGLQIKREIPCICHHFDTNKEPCPRFYRYDDLVQRMNVGKHRVECPQSYQEVSVIELLYGIHASTNERVLLDIKELQQEMLKNQVSEKLTLEKITQLCQLIIRNQFIQWNYEMKNLSAECPNIFFLSIANSKPFNPKNWISQEYHMQLVCQHPDGPHAVGDGYSLREAQDWWCKVSPWLNHLITFLKIAGPIGKAIGDVYDTTQFQHIANQIALVQEIIKLVPTLNTHNSLNDTVSDPHINHNQGAVGPALRALYHFLDKVDPAHEWGGLYKTITLDGDILWLCKEHSLPYQPKPLNEQYLS